jgi:hypothetical protein
MISEQYGTVFVNEHYEQLRKVYSIWICPDPAKKRANGIFKYTIEENEIYGRSGMKVENYDLMEVIILNLGNADKKSDVEILNLLNTLFSTNLSSDEKKKILSDDFHIAMTKELESEVSDMCNVSYGIEEKGVQKGLQQGLQQGLLECLGELGTVTADIQNRICAIREPDTLKTLLRAATKAKTLDDFITCLNQLQPTVMDQSY